VDWAWHCTFLDNPRNEGTSHWQRVPPYVGTGRNLIHHKTSTHCHNHNHRRNSLRYNHNWHHSSHRYIHNWHRSMRPRNNRRNTYRHSHSRNKLCEQYLASAPIDFGPRDTPGHNRFGSSTAS